MENNTLSGNVFIYPVLFSIFSVLFFFSCSKHNQKPQSPFPEKLHLYLCSEVMHGQQHFNFVFVCWWACAAWQRGVQITSTTTPVGT